MSLEFCREAERELCGRASVPSGRGRMLFDNFVGMPSRRQYVMFRGEDGEMFTYREVNEQEVGDNNMARLALGHASLGRVNRQR